MVYLPWTLRLTYPTSNRTVNPTVNLPYSLTEPWIPRLTYPTANRTMNPAVNLPYS